MMNKPDNSTIKKLAKLFLKLRTIGFGGPAAQIAMMQDEVVKKLQKSIVPTPLRRKF